MSNEMFAVVSITLAVWLGIFIRLSRRGGSLGNIFSCSILLPILAFVFSILAFFEIIAELRSKIPFLGRPYYFTVILLVVISLYPQIISNLYSKYENGKVIKIVFPINRFLIQGRNIATSEFKSNLPAEMVTGN